MTPETFVAALRASGVYAILITHGGPGSPALPTGLLPDGRAWIVGNETGDWNDDDMSGPLHIDVYEAPAVVTSTDLEINGDHVACLAGCTTVQAFQALHRAASGDYSLLTVHQEKEV